MSSELEKLTPRVNQDLQNLADGTHVGFMCKAYADQCAAITMKALYNMVVEAENQKLQNAAYAEFYQNMCEDYEKKSIALQAALDAIKKDNRRLTIESGVYHKTVNDLDEIHAAHTAILEKALALACESIRHCSMTHLIDCKEVTKDNHWVKSFIQQATEDLKKGNH